MCTFLNINTLQKKTHIHINWHTKSQGHKKKCTHFSRGRIHSCPAGTARNQGSFTSMALLSVQSFLSSTVTLFNNLTSQGP